MRTQIAKIALVMAAGAFLFAGLGCSGGDDITAGQKKEVVKKKGVKKGSKKDIEFLATE